MIQQSLKMAWKAVALNKMRTFLTMLGIIIGIFSLVVLVSLVKGATASVTDSVSSLGTNMLTITINDDKGNPLKMRDLSEFAENEEIREVAPLAQANIVAAAAGNEENAIVYGTTGSYFSIQGLETETGRLLKSVDVDNHSNAAVISASTATDILGRWDVVGETIKLDGTSFYIVGVLTDEENSMTSMMGTTYQVYIPYTSFIRMKEGASSDVTSFYVSATSEDTLDIAEEQMKSILMGRFGQDEDAFSITNQSSIMDVMSSITDTLSLLLGGIAGISLLVGGIGIMNIMLVSVTERTREIGIRKAIGAGRGTIMLQFLIEAFMVSMMGCLIGLILSWITMKVINQIGNVDYGLSMGIVLIAIVFSMLVGLIFGLYPANKAAKKKPIDALRYTG